MNLRNKFSGNCIHMRRCSVSRQVYYSRYVRTASRGRKYCLSVSPLKCVHAHAILGDEVFNRILCKEMREKEQCGAIEEKYRERCLCASDKRIECVYMCVCMYMYVYVCMCMYVCMCTCKKREEKKRQMESATDEDRCCCFSKSIGTRTDHEGELMFLT